MDWYQEFYAGESIAGKKEKIRRKVLRNAGVINIYIIALSSNPENLLDIIPSWELMQKYYPKSELLVVGVDRGYENAIELAGTIIMDVYQKPEHFKSEIIFWKNTEKIKRKGINGNPFYHFKNNRHSSGSSAVFVYNRNFGSDSVPHRCQGAGWDRRKSSDSLAVSFAGC